MSRIPDPCPCCCYRTLGTQGGNARCPVCFWRRDGRSPSETSDVVGTLNGTTTLAEARANFRRLGACEARFLAYVRAPKRGELPRADLAG
jgi:hypothetical protein